MERGHFTYHRGSRKYLLALMRSCIRTQYVTQHESTKALIVLQLARQLGGDKNTIDAAKEKLGKVIDNNQAVISQIAGALS